MSLPIIAFPSLVFLASFGACARAFRKPISANHITDTATGIWFIYQTAQPNGVWGLFPANIGLPYFAISCGLNVLLTLIILVRLVQYGRNVRSAMGSRGRISGMYRAGLAILIESCGLYAINSLLFIIPWGVGSYVSSIFLPILAQIQVCVPLSSWDIVI